MDSSLQQLVRQFARLPGLGPKSAQRIVFHLLQRDPAHAAELQKTLLHALNTIQHCEYCRALSEQSPCNLCQDSERERHRLCVIEHPADLLALEHTGVYQGLYFVLHGHLSPIDGVSPDTLALPQLRQRVVTERIEEIILATNPTMEGEATAYYIRQMFKDLPHLRLNRIACGVPMGSEIEFIDGNTLSLALRSRRSMDEHV